ncbi:unnamed protein product [Urochloa humidicola]
MVWIPCSACCLLCQKVRDTKRVYRGRRARRPDDVELGEFSTSTYGTGGGSSSSDGDDRRGGITAGSRRSRGKSSSSASLARERRKDRIRQSLRLKRVSSKVERATMVNDQRRSGRRQRHSTGPRKITEAPPPPMSSPSSLRVHGSPAARGRHSHAHRRA